MRAQGHSHPDCAGNGNPLSVECAKRAEEACGELGRAGEPMEGRGERDEAVLGELPPTNVGNWTSQHDGCDEVRKAAGLMLSRDGGEHGQGKHRAEAQKPCEAGDNMGLFGPEVCLLRYSRGLYLNVTGGRCSWYDTRQPRSKHKPGMKVRVEGPGGWVRILGGGEAGS